MASRNQGIRQKALEPVVEHSRGKGEESRGPTASAYRGDASERRGKDNTQRPRNACSLTSKHTFPTRLAAYPLVLRDTGSLRVTLSWGMLEILHTKEFNELHGRLQRGLSGEEDLLLQEKTRVLSTHSHPQLQFQGTPKPSSGLCWQEVCACTWCIDTLQARHSHA